jgi:hypothetical protein
MNFKFNQHTEFNIHFITLRFVFYTKINLTIEILIRYCSLIYAQIHGFSNFHRIDFPGVVT